MERPAPSPVSGSHPQAPRWVRLINTWIPFNNNVVRFVTLDVGHEAHAARVAFIARMVETLGRR